MFDITEIPFDSGILARKVGKITLHAASIMDHNIITSIKKALNEEQYTFASLSTPQKIDSLDKLYCGTLIHLDGLFESVKKKLAQINGRTKIRPIQTEDWPAIHLLLKQASKTRFSLDPNISEVSRIEHKLTILKVYQEKNPSLSLVAYDENENIIGFHFSSIENEDLIFSEILIHEPYRKGLVAYELLAEVIASANNDGVNPIKVKTKVYQHNKMALRFFKGLKVDCEVKQEHYYHFWV